MAKDVYVCNKCWYEYGENSGPESTDVDINFINLPEDWVCPVCGASKSQFSNLVAGGLFDRVNN